MIHDFATLPRQPREQDQAAAPVKLPPQPVKVGWVLVLALVLTLSFLVHFFGYERVSTSNEFSPGVAESQEYQQAAMDEGSLLAAEPDVVAEAVAMDSAPVGENHAEASNPATLKKRDFELALSQNPNESNDFGFYESLSSSNWRVPVQKGIYFTEEDRKRANSRYILQAASLRDRQEAEKLVRKLRGLKMEASYKVSHNVYSGTWFQVMVGPFRDHSVMNKAEDVLAGMRIKPLKRRLP